MKIKLFFLIKLTFEFHLNLKINQLVMSVKLGNKNSFVHKKDYFEKENFFSKSVMEGFYVNEKIKGANPQ